MVNRTLSIWNDLRPYAVGFDSLFDHFNNTLEYTVKQQTSYPPYNINKIDDLNYQVEMALAGFGKDDIEIKYSDNQLTIKSVESDDKDEKDVIHRGISKRKFSRSFTLAEDIKVNGAELKDGMLLVELEKIVPEEKRPRTIAIK
jgi:molecular chaperone IbpA|tara:strand:+ start:113 stop:544 length:432 start_codon:yes stop_codon:yes gene_type:complete